MTNYPQRVTEPTPRGLLKSVPAMTELLGLEFAWSMDGIVLDSGIIVFGPVVEPTLCRASPSSCGPHTVCRKWTMPFRVMTPEIIAII